MDQLTFDILQQTDEECFIEAVGKEMLLEPGYAPYISAQNNKGYVSFRVKGNVPVKVYFRKACIKVEFLSRYEKFFKLKNYEVIRTSDDDKWSTVTFNNLDKLLASVDCICKVAVNYLIESQGDTFGCCSSYQKCSDAKKCVRADSMFSLGCTYRKHLEKGRIFYGKNRNID